MELDCYLHLPCSLLGCTAGRIPTIQPLPVDVFHMKRPCSDVSRMSTSKPQIDTLLAAQGAPARAAWKQIIRNVQIPECLHLIFQVLGAPDAAGAPAAADALQALCSKSGAQVVAAMQPNMLQQFTPAAVLELMRAPAVRAAVVSIAGGSSQFISTALQLALQELEPLHVPAETGALGIEQLNMSVPAWRLLQALLVQREFAWADLLHSAAPHAAALAHVVRTGYILFAQHGLVARQWLNVTAGVLAAQLLTSEQLGSRTAAVAHHLASITRAAPAELPSLAVVGLVRNLLDMLDIPAALGMPAGLACLQAAVQALLQALPESNEVQQIMVIQGIQLVLNTCADLEPAMLPAARELLQDEWVLPLAAACLSSWDAGMKTVRTAIPQLYGTLLRALVTACDKQASALRAVAQEHLDIVLAQPRGRPPRYQALAIAIPTLGARVSLEVRPNLLDHIEEACRTSSMTVNVASTALLEVAYTVRAEIEERLGLPRGAAAGGASVGGAWIQPAAETEPELADRAALGAAYLYMPIIIELLLSADRQIRGLTMSRLVPQCIAQAPPTFQVLYSVLAQLQQYAASVPAAPAADIADDASPAAVFDAICEGRGSWEQLGARCWSSAQRSLQALTPAQLQQCVTAVRIELLTTARNQKFLSQEHADAVFGSWLAPSAAVPDLRAQLQLQAHPPGFIAVHSQLATPGTAVAADIALLREALASPDVDVQLQAFRLVACPSSSATMPTPVELGMMARACVAGLGWGVTDAVTQRTQLLARAAARLTTTLYKAQRRVRWLRDLSAAVGAEPAARVGDELLVGDTRVILTEDMAQQLLAGPRVVLQALQVDTTAAALRYIMQYAIQHLSALSRSDRAFPALMLMRELLVHWPVLPAEPSCPAGFVDSLHSPFTDLLCAPSAVASLLSACMSTFDRVRHEAGEVLGCIPGALLQEHCKAAGLQWTSWMQNIVQGAVVSLSLPRAMEAEAGARVLGWAWSKLGEQGVQTRSQLFPTPHCTQTSEPVDPLVHWRTGLVQVLQLLVQRVRAFAAATQHAGLHCTASIETDVADAVPPALRAELCAHGTGPVPPLVHGSLVAVGELCSRMPWAALHARDAADTAQVLAAAVGLVSAAYQVCLRVMAEVPDAGVDTADQGSGMSKGRVDCKGHLMFGSMDASTQEEDWQSASAAPSCSVEAVHAAASRAATQWADPQDAAGAVEHPAQTLVVSSWQLARDAALTMVRIAEHVPRGPADDASTVLRDEQVAAMCQLLLRSLLRLKHMGSVLHVSQTLQTMAAACLAPAGAAPVQTNEQSGKARKTRRITTGVVVTRLTDCSSRALLAGLTKLAAGSVEDWSLGSLDLRCTDVVGQWLAVLLQRVRSSEQQFVLRRSAGFAQAFMCLLRSLPTAQAPALIHTTITALLLLAAHGQSAEQRFQFIQQLHQCSDAQPALQHLCSAQLLAALAQPALPFELQGAPELQCPSWRAAVHAMNVLKLLLRDGLLARHAAPFLPHAMQVAITAFDDQLWGVRNSGLMLFATACERGFGTKVVATDSADDNSLSLGRFFSKFPKLGDFVVGLLRSAAGAAADTRAPGAQPQYSLHPALFPCMSVLARLRPNPPDVRAECGTLNGSIGRGSEPQGGMQGQVFIDTVLPMLLPLLGSVHARLRIMAARAMAALCTPLRALAMLQVLLQDLATGRASDNLVHGLGWAICECAGAVQRFAARERATPYLSLAGLALAWRHVVLGQLPSQAQLVAWQARHCPLACQAVWKGVRALSELQNELHQAEPCSPATTAVGWQRALLDAASEVLAGLAQHTAAGSAPGAGLALSAVLATACTLAPAHADRAGAVLRTAASLQPLEARVAAMRAVYRSAALDVRDELRAELCDLAWRGLRDSHAQVRRAAILGLAALQRVAWREEPAWRTNWAALLAAGVGFVDTAAVIGWLRVLVLGLNAQPAEDMDAAAAWQCAGALASALTCSALWPVRVVAAKLVASLPWARIPGLPALVLRCAMADAAEDEDDEVRWRMWGSLQSLGGVQGSGLTDASLGGNRVLLRAVQHIMPAMGDDLRLRELASAIVCHRVCSLVPQHLQEAMRALPTGDRTFLTPGSWLWSAALLLRQACPAAAVALVQPVWAGAEATPPAIAAIPPHLAQRDLFLAAHAAPLQAVHLGPPRMLVHAAAGNAADLVRSMHSASASGQDVLASFAGEDGSWDWLLEHRLFPAESCNEFSEPMATVRAVQAAIDAMPVGLSPSHADWLRAAIGSAALQVQPLVEVAGPWHGTGIARESLQAAACVHQAELLLTAVPTLA